MQKSMRQPMHAASVNFFMSRIAPAPWCAPPFFLQVPPWHSSATPWSFQAQSNRHLMRTNRAIPLGRPLLRRVAWWPKRYSASGGGRPAAMHADWKGPYLLSMLTSKLSRDGGRTRYQPLPLARGSARCLHPPRARASSYAARLVLLATFNNPGKSCSSHSFCASHASGSGG